MPAMSVWVDGATWKAINEVAQEMSEATGFEVTKSDILKQAIRDFLKSR